MTKRLKRVLLVAASTLVGAVGLSIALVLAASWLPLLVGTDPDGEVSVTAPRLATSEQQRIYGVASDQRVLAEVSIDDHRIAGGADFYSVRFEFEPYRMILRCTGESVGLQESANYRKRLRLQQTSVGGHLRCGAEQPQRLDYNGNGAVTIDVIDTQYVAHEEWGVLVIAG